MLLPSASALVHLASTSQHLPAPSQALENPWGLEPPCPSLPCPEVLQLFICHPGHSWRLQASFARLSPQAQKSILVFYQDSSTRSPGHSTLTCSIGQGNESGMVVNSFC